MPDSTTVPTTARPNLNIDNLININFQLKAGEFRFKEAEPIEGKAPKFLNDPLNTHA